MTRFVLFLFIFVLSVPACLAKGPTVRIEISGEGQSLTLEDPAIVSRFSIWYGPGVGTPTSGVEAHVDSNQPTSFIDWPRRFATERPEGLPRYDVVFLVGLPERPETWGKYPVNYEIDLANGEGYIFLPSGATDLIVHGIEDNWFYATDRWNTLIMPIIQEHRTDEQ